MKDSRPKDNLEEKWLIEIEHFINKKRSDGLDAKSITSYLTNLKRLQQYLDKNALKVSNIDEKELKSYIETLKNSGFTSSSLNQNISTLRGFFSYLEQETSKKSPASNLGHYNIKEDEKYNDLKSVKEFLVAVESCDKIKLRDRLILILLIRYGMSGATICNLKFENLSFENNTFTITIHPDVEIIIDENTQPAYSLMKDYYEEIPSQQLDCFVADAPRNDKLPQKAAPSYNFFLTSNNKPLTTPHIIYILNSATKKLNFDDISLVTIAKLNLSRKISVKKDEIINDRYQIKDCIEKTSNEDIFKVIDLKDNSSTRLMHFFILSEPDYKLHWDNISKTSDLLKTIDHPYVAKVCDYGYLEKYSAFYIIEDYIAGKKLEAFAEKLNIKQVMDLFEKLLEGLSFIHLLGIYHLNISPDTIMIIARWKSLNPKYTLFNYPKLLKLPIKEHIKKNPSGSMELKIEDGSEKEADIYSLGMTLYHLITGTYQAHTDRSNILAEGRNYPEYFCDIMQKMINPKTSDSFRDATCLLNTYKNIRTPKYSCLNKINIESPVPIDILNNLKTIVYDLKNDRIKTNPFIIKLDTRTKSSKLLLLAEITNILKVESIPSLTLDCKGGETLLDLKNLLSEKKTISDYENYEIGKSLKSNYNIDYTRNKATFFLTLFQSLTSKCPLVLIINNVDFTSKSFFEGMSFILKKFKESKEKVIIVLGADSESQKGELFSTRINSNLDEEQILNITLEPFSNFELKRYLIELFNAEIHDDFLEFAYAQSKGDKGDLFNILKNLIQNELLLYNSEGCIELANQAQSEQAKPEPNLSSSNSLLTSKKENDSTSSTNVLIRLSDNLYNSKEYDKALKFMMIIVEESLLNGLLNDAKGYSLRAMEFYNYYSKKEGFYLVLTLARIFSDLLALDEAQKRFELLDRIEKDQEEQEQEQKLLVATYKAKFLVNKGNLDGAVTLLMDGITLAKKLKEIELELHLVMLLSTTLMMLSRFDSADEIIKRYLDLDMLKSIPAKRLQLSNQLALLNYYQSNYASALDILKGVEKEAKKLDKISIEIYSKHTMAMINYRLGNYSSAIQSYNENLTLYEKHNDILGKAITIDALAIVYHKVGRFKKALELYQEGVAIYDILGRSLGYEDMLHGLATIYCNLGDIAVAKKYFKIIYEIVNKTDKPHQLGYCHWLLATINKKEGELENAINNYEIAIDIFKKNQLINQMYLCTLNLAELFILLDSSEKAEKILGQFANSEILKFQDISLKLLIERARFELYSDLCNEPKVSEYFDLIDKSPLIDQDWESSLNYHSLKILYFKRSNQIDKLESEIMIMQSKIDTLCEGLSDDLAEHFKNQYDFVNYDYSARIDKSGTINSDELIQILSNITNSLNENILLNKILKYFLRLTSADIGFFILPQKSGDHKVYLCKNSRDLNLKMELPEFYNSVIDNALHSKGEPIIKKDIMAISLVNSDDVVGILCGQTRTEAITQNVDPYIEWIKCLKQFASHSAISILNARKYSNILSRVNILQDERDNLEREKESQTISVEQKSVALERAENQISFHEKRSKLGHENIIGKSKRMKEIMILLEKLSNSDVSVLINGESGTGKEVIARAIHKSSMRKNNQFFAENCAAFSETLLESELFGHIKGSYTGATLDQPGIFEIADGGTVFLDEVGDMSLNMQQKLLRIVQEGEVRRIGETQCRKINVRIISATNRDLKSLIGKGKFREDLYFRLNVISIVMPPLRERKEDIENLIFYFVNRYSDRDKKGKIEIDYEIIEAFKRYKWPGNIRELENEVQRLLIMCDGTKISKDIILNDPRYF